MARSRALAVALLAGAIGLAGASPALAQVQRRLDGYPVQAANVDLLAAQLIAHKVLESGDRVFVATDPKATPEEFFVASALVAGLMARGVGVQEREAGATRRFEYVWLRDSTDPLGELRVLDIGGKPDPGTRIRNRIAYRVTDPQSGLVKASGIVTAETLPFAAAGGDAPGGGGAASESAAPAEPAAASVPGDTQGVGLAVSYLAGSGITYRRWFDSGLGFQVAAIPWFQPSQGETSGFVNVGLAGMGTLLLAENFRAFWILGYGLFYGRYVSSPVSAPGAASTTPTTTVTEVQDHGAAPGIGLDYHFNRNLALHAGLAYTVSYKVRPPGSYDAGLGFSPGGQLGAFFYF